MILYPAIDLKDGACVRLIRGEMANATVFNDDPTTQARQFADAGFPWLHVVDLDGAFVGHSVNSAAVRAIRRGVDLKIQLGGGIRDRAAIDYWLGLGIDRIVLGTAALRDSELVRRAAAEHPAAIAVGVDARDGRVAIEGWAETTEVGVVELAAASKIAAWWRSSTPTSDVMGRSPVLMRQRSPNWRDRSGSRSSSLAGFHRSPTSPR